MNPSELATSVAAAAQKTQWASIKQFESKQPVLRVLPIYIRIAGDLKSGVLLSQLVYWWKPDKTGKSKLRVKRNGRFWVARTRTDWQEEIGLGMKEYLRAAKVLTDLGLIEIEVFKFAGNPTQHIWLNVDLLVQILHKFPSKDKLSGENESYE